MAKLKGLHELMNEEEIRRGLEELHSDMDNEVDFEGFLKVINLFLTYSFAIGSISCKRITCVLDGLAVRQVQNREMRVTHGEGWVVV